MTAPLERPLEVPDRPARGSSVRRSVAIVLAGLLAATTAACTSSDPQAEPPAAGGSSGPADPSTTPEPAPAAPARVRVTRVSGKLKEKDREVLADNVEKVVTAYFDDAFVGGDYPRDSFGDAFATFSAGAAQQADGDRDLLTNRVLGPTTETVEVRRRTAYLSVLAPYKVAAGVTARVHLRFVADRGDKPAKRVDVRGRLMLTRKSSGGWQIFGYDLSKNARTVGEES
ncbi:MAG TPA: hypothetical protein VFH10_05615 [Nocardioides sp.]|uniref:hypothetical protein n=1 Tax=Nocardioides sp. TaxID=35761 RepID=UPI002D7F550F|nr:hypothetical protein [Nocardioides sp.]HET6652099.1 hypothetical protein [Nocardioides sp.]